MTIYRTIETGFDMLKSAPDYFDMVVVDQELESISGGELSQQFIQLKVNIPLVLLLAEGKESSMDDALRLGIESCLYKPATENQYAALPIALLEIYRRHNDRIAREKAVEGLRESQTRLQKIVEASTMPIFVIDTNHCITEWNLACEALTGLPAKEMIFTSDAWKAFYPAPRPTMADLIIDGLMQAELAKHSAETVRESPFGEGYEAEDFFPSLAENGKWLFIAAAPLRNNQGELIGAITTLQDITETHCALESLERATSWLSQILDGSTIPTFVIDREHKITHWNRACEVLTGTPADEVIGTSNQWQAFYPEQRPVMADLIIDNVLEEEIALHYASGYRHALLGHGYEAEGFFPCLGEKGRWLFFSAAPIRSVSGKIVGAIETLQDITDRRKTEEALAESQKRLSQIIEGSAVATFVINNKHIVIEWNRACEQLTGVSAEEMIGTSNQWKPFSAEKRPVLADYILDGVSEKVFEEQYGNKYRRSLLGEGFEVEDFFTDMGEEGTWLFFTAAPLRNTSGKIIGAIETLQDVTRRRKAEEALRASESHYRELSITDGLTGLFNVRYFHLCAAEEIDRADRYNRSLSLLIMDIDDFKHFNDTYGHPQGDLVLQRFAREIPACLRRNDAMFRYGGEEFVVMLPETPLNEAVVVAEKIRQKFAGQIFTPAPEIAVSKTMSIGVAQWARGENVVDLLSRADEHLYKAKRSGKNKVVAEQK